jgi:hypothetical protein
MASGDEKKGIAALIRASAPFRPFKDPHTQYYILGDGSGRKFATALRKASVMPVSPAMSIDPCYSSRPWKSYIRPTARRWPPAATRRIVYIDSTAEKYRIRRRDIAQATNIVVLACRAHTSIVAFIRRIRQIKSAKTRLFAACIPCHYPGLRGKILISRGWQLLCPRGSRGNLEAGGTTARKRKNKAGSSR